MQPKEMLRVILLVSFGAAVAIQDGSIHTMFKPTANLNHGSLIQREAAFAEGVTEGIEMEKSEEDQLLKLEELVDSEGKGGKGGSRGGVRVGVGGGSRGSRNTGGGGEVPAGRKQMYFRPVSVTLQCVMVLVIVSALVYTALSLSRNADELSATFSPSVPTQMLTIGARVSSFAPMLCMLFVGCRMFVLATTEGLGEPPLWVKNCMWTSVIGVALQLLIVMVLPMFTKKQAEEEAAYDMTEGKKAAWEAGHHDDTKPPTDAEEGGAAQAVHDAVGEQNDVHPDLNSVELTNSSACLKGPFWIVQTLSMLAIYGGVTGVVVGILTFPSQSTKISAAVLCTICMSVLYFTVCFFLWAARATTDANSAMTNMALCMSTTVRKAPMFAVLFLASRMRALQLDPPYGMPPFWMQCCFYGITACLFLEALAGACVAGSGEKTKGYYGVYIFRCPSKAAHLVHHGIALITYALLIPVVYGVYQMKDSTGAPAALSTTMGCVLQFTAVYFGVMLSQELVLFAEQFEETELTMLRDTTISAGISLGLAPLLCILFVATRMRALQITQQQGAPPGWAQDCMLIAVFATCVQALCCLLMPIFIGSACQVDEDGNPDYDLKPMVGAYAVAVVKYVALMALHGSIIAICVAVFVMTPETAHNGGRFITSKKDLFKGLAGTLGVFALALLFSSAKVVGMAVKIAIESADQELIGVNITIKKVALNLFMGYVNITKLKVCQPQDEINWVRSADGKVVGTPTGKQCDWKEDYIAKVDLILVKINLWRLATSCGSQFELENLSIKGIHVNVEKPDTNVKKENANVQYIINHLDALGLIPPPEDEVIAKVEEVAEPKKEGAKEEVPFDFDMNMIPQIIIGKIVLGDIGAGVCIRGVKIIGQISFHPSIGLIEFDNVQQQVFNGKEDLKPGEIVACIISAIMKKIVKTVTSEMPAQLKKAASGAVNAVKDKALDGVDKALKKVPCQ